MSRGGAAAEHLCRCMQQRLGRVGFGEERLHAIAPFAAGHVFHRAARGDNPDPRIETSFPSVPLAKESTWRTIAAPRSAPHADDDPPVSPDGLDAVSCGGEV